MSYLVQNGWMFTEDPYEILHRNRGPVPDMWMRGRIVAGFVGEELPIGLLKDALNRSGYRRPSGRRWRNNDVARVLVSARGGLEEYAAWPRWSLWPYQQWVLDVLRLRAHEFEPYVGPERRWCPPGGEPATYPPLNRWGAGP